MCTRNITEHDHEDFLERFDSVMIIPIEGNEPVLIFKKFGRPLKHEESKFEPRSTSFVFDNIYTNMVLWKDNRPIDRYPDIIKQEYGHLFWSFLNKKDCSYDISDLPKGVIELPLKMLMKNEDIKIFHPHYITPVKNTLRKLGLLDELRGRIKGREGVNKDREEFVIRLYEKLMCSKKKLRIPITKIHDAWTAEVDKRFPHDSEKAEEYYGSEATIRRIIQYHMKK